MMGKTHFAVGTATTLLLLHPQTVKSTLLCAGTAAICSCICDVDVSSSGSHKGMTKFCIGFGLVALILGVLDWRCEIGLRNYLMNNSSILRMLLGIVLLMGICLFGETQPHRTFLHSFFGIACICGAIAIFLPQAVPYAAVAMLTHVALDLLNMRKVQLFYPFQFGKCSLRLCPADSFPDKVLFWVGPVCC